MTRRTISAVTAAVLGAAGLAGLAASDDGDRDVAITGDALDRATAAALEHTGGGTVTATEVGDEESLYEVEVTRDDGSQVDVQLDADFTVVGEEADAEDGD